MNIGGISNMNYAAAMRLNTPSLAMQLNTPGGNIRTNSPAAEYTTRSAMQQPVAVPVTPALMPLMPISLGTGSVFFSPDGDIAEISSSGMLEALKSQGVCHTCENRRYVDQSDDASVSFQSPTKVSPNMAGAAVAAHEQEHVRNEQANAMRDNREIVNQSVTLHYDTCPECGKMYVSGGTTKTTTIGKSDSEDGFEPAEMSPGETSSEEEK